MSIMLPGCDVINPQTLNELQTPAPTASWCPVAHNNFRSLVHRHVEASGLQIEDETIGISHQANRMFGMLTIRNGHDDRRELIAYRNSHDKAFSLSLAMGVKVMICSNLDISGEIVVSRKHTTHIVRDLDSLVCSAVGRLGDIRDRHNVRIDAYKATPLDDRNFHDTLVRGVEAKVVAPNKIINVLKEWRSPRHEEFKPRNVWSAYNTFTEVLKDYNIHSLGKRCAALHGIYDMISGVQFAHASMN